MWPDLIKKAKEGGLDAIETYVFWNAHEPLRRQYDFTGNLDLIRFIKTVQDQGLYAVLRIGPYVCAEWNYGGFPVWLHNMPGIEFRTANKVFMNEMQNFTSLIVDMMKKEKLFASQGGPIILAQIENEYGNVISSYGDAGKAYMNWCANMANSLDIGVPWIMCQQNDAPTSVINTCNGWYCDQFTPNNPNSPKMWTENWTGWFKNWGGKDPYRTAEDLAFSVARFFQLGGSFQNYYMYHGGTNFGRTSGGPYITTTYDYDAPLNEFGSLNQPKYGHLKQLHDVLHSIEKTLTYGNISSTDYGNSVSATIYSTNDQQTCFFGNANTTTDATVTYQGVKYNVPAWSVSILPTVNTQTSKMVKVSNKAENEPIALKWTWMPESVHETLVHGKGEALPATFLIKRWLMMLNYGPNFDEIRTGLPGPIEIIGEKGDESIMKDLSNHTWTYKVGLDGFNTKLFDNAHDKTTFKAPLGEEPVAVDLQGLGKGMAWVNGNSLGRYWPSYMEEDGCSAEPCDYRGSYDNSKCVTNCGQPTQRWPISGIKFASFGNVQGVCGAFQKGTCEAKNDVLSLLQNACVGKESCVVRASESSLGLTSCDSNTTKRLVVEAIC
ncbi:UNVERIFIED_CONTAM: Beta-galactosidase 15 [Sesamum angustifolium]|uniref:Beta-galactosidase n=1 Tax=Sesamum angustifolium TaxID=2727405 RepID=A0AAW2LFU7_9LAMI